MNHFMVDWVLRLSCPGRNICKCCPPMSTYQREVRQSRSSQPLGLKIIFSNICKNSNSRMMLILSLLALLPLTFAAEWDYIGDYGPEHWDQVAPACGLSYQSPININKHEAEYNHEIPKFEFDNYNSSEGVFLLTNNGHTVGASLPVNISLTGGGLPEKFYASQFHFHWGSVGLRGSEHTIDGRSYEAELHIVHHNSKHDHIGQAINETEGLAVLGIFIRIGERNGAYERFFRHMDKIKHKNNMTEIPAFPLQGFLPTDLSEFWRYRGSLTTPPCYESVIWTVFQNPVEISEDQMDKLRSAMFDVDRPMVDNFRPIQPLGDRVVYNVKTNDTEEDTVYFFNEDEDNEGGEHEVHWDYKGKYGPAHWGDYFPECKKAQQSPIDIIPDDAIVDADLEPFAFQGYDQAPDTEYLVLNNGHTLGTILPVTQVVRGGGLPNNYIADQFHFHWGLTDCMGSEHRVNGESFPLELHIVHHSSKYDDIGLAVDKDEGLAVLGIFFRIGRYNDAFDKLKKYLANVTYNDEKVQAESFPLDTLLPRNKTGFFRYQGSLTTPPCYESVIWTVFHEPVEISSEQLAFFRALKKNIRESNDQTPLGPDYRPTQPLLGRKVYTSMPYNPPPPVPTTTTTTTTTRPTVPRRNNIRPNNGVSSITQSVAFTTSFVLFLMKLL